MVKINPFMKSTTQDSLWLFNVCQPQDTSPQQQLSCCFETQGVFTECWVTSAAIVVTDLLTSPSNSLKSSCLNYCHLKWTKENTSHILILQFWFNTTECKNTWIFTEALEWGFWNFVYGNATRQLELTLNVLVGNWKICVHPSKVSLDSELIQLTSNDE